MIRLCIRVFACFTASISQMNGDKQAWENPLKHRKVHRGIQITWYLCNASSLLHADLYCSFDFWLRFIRIQKSKHRTILYVLRTLMFMAMSSTSSTLERGLAFMTNAGLTVIDGKSRSVKFRFKRYILLAFQDGNGQSKPECGSLSSNCLYQSRARIDMKRRVK